MAQWSGKSIGPLIGYKIFLFTIRIFGVKPAYFLLNFVTNYYFLFAKTIRTNLKKFYQQALGLTSKDALRMARKNLKIFGQVMVDRNAFLLSKGDDYTYSFINDQVLFDIKAGGKGALLISAHLGNWETAANMLRKRISNTINAIMVDAEVGKIKQYVNNRTGGSHFNIIPIKNDLSHIIKIKNALDRNELIAVHADRNIEGAKSVTVDFFNHPVEFPYGPFLIAHRFKVPIIFVYAIKEGSRHYVLSATPPVEDVSSPEQIAKAYVAELESRVRKNPEQWFNYYDYFKK